MALLLELPATVLPWQRARCMGICNAARTLHQRKRACRAPALLVLPRDDAAGSVITTCLVTSPPGLVTTLLPTGACCMWTTAKRGGIARASAHAGSRARVTSMGGLYDAATLRALVVVSKGALLEKRREEHKEAAADSDQILQRICLLTMQFQARF